MLPPDGFLKGRPCLLLHITGGLLLEHLAHFLADVEVFAPECGKFLRPYCLWKDP